MISKKWAIFLIIVVILIVFEVGQILGWFSYTWITTNLSIFIVAVVLISLFSVVGAMFLGMYVSHRFFSTKGFTPFEEEMMRAREDIKKIKEDIQNIEKAVAELTETVKKGK